MNMRVAIRSHRGACQIADLFGGDASERCDIRRAKRVHADDADAAVVEERFELLVDRVLIGRDDRDPLGTF